MVILTDIQLVQALNKAVGKQADFIMESCRLYHFYFGTLSFSYNKADVIKLLTKE